MAKKNAQEAFEIVKARILEDVTANFTNLQKSELNKSLFGLPSSTPPAAQITKDAGLPVKSVFSVLSLGKGEELAKIGTMSHMMAVGTKKNKPVRVLKGNRSPKPTTTTSSLKTAPARKPAAAAPVKTAPVKTKAPASPVVATIKKTKAKAAKPVAATGPQVNPNWASELGVQPAQPQKFARTKGIPSSLRMSHGEYRIQANADGSSSLLYTKKHKSPIMNFIFGSKPKDLGRFAHRAEAYDSLLGHHDQIAAGLIKDEYSDSNSEQSAQVDPASVHDMEPVLSRAKENIPNQEHCDSEELSAPGSGGDKKKENQGLSKAADGSGAPAAPGAMAAPAMPKPAAPKPLTAMPRLKSPATLAGKQGYAYEHESTPTAAGVAPQAPSVNFKRGAGPQAIEQGGTGNNWVPGQQFTGKILNPLTPPVLKNEMPTGPVQGAGAVTGDNALDKSDGISVTQPKQVGPIIRLNSPIPGIIRTAGPNKDGVTVVPAGETALNKDDRIRMGGSNPQSKMMTRDAMSQAAFDAKNAKMPTQQQVKPPQIADRGPVQAGADLSWLTGQPQAPIGSVAGAGIPGFMPGASHTQLLKGLEDLEKEVKEQFGCQTCGMAKGCRC